MSDIERFIWASVVTPAVGGDWVRYTDHQAEVERLREERDEAHSTIYRLAGERDKSNSEVERLTFERDQAQAEVKNLNAQMTDAIVRIRAMTAERDEAQAEVERLRANGQRMFDGSRPSDEDIWRHAFMATLQSPHYNRTKMADEVLAEYRKRWPR